MYYADIKQYDVANGPGVRVSLFVSGCNTAAKTALMRKRGILNSAMNLQKKRQIELSNT